MTMKQGRTLMSADLRRAGDIGWSPRVVKVLYLDQHLTLWGLPYDLCPGQSPRDIERAPRPHVCTARCWGCGGGEPRGIPDDWIYLGDCGSWGHLEIEQIELAKVWLALQPKLGNWYEYDTVNALTEDQWADVEATAATRASVIREDRAFRQKAWEEEQALHGRPPESWRDEILDAASSPEGLLPGRVVTMNFAHQVNRMAEAGEVLMTLFIQPSSQGLADMLGIKGGQQQLTPQEADAMLKAAKCKSREDAHKLLRVIWKTPAQTGGKEC